MPALIRVRSRIYSGYLGWGKRYDNCWVVFWDNGLNSFPDESEVIEVK